MTPWLTLPCQRPPVRSPIASQLKKYRNHDGLVVVFSTYQSIDAVSAAQQEILSETDGEYGVFDFIICDEAHRTTGVKLSDKDESNFTKIHSNDNVQGCKRLLHDCHATAVWGIGQDKGIGKGLHPLFDGRQGFVRG